MATKTTVSPLVPATSGSQTSTHSLLPRSSQYTPLGSLPNTPLAVSVISAALGGLATASMVLAAAPVFQSFAVYGAAWAKPQLGVYLAAFGTFHLLEFWTTAGWNVQKLSVDAFLLNNTKQYNLAHAFGLAEYLVSSYLLPRKFDSWYCSIPWISLVIVVLVTGQVVRSLAMIHASASFSHVVKAVKHDDHTLVTTGIYSWSRHPSYVGFFYWAIATQLVLGNVVSTLAFAVVLGRFFSARIRDEERYLVRFFGDEYVQYRRRVGTGLPSMAT